jgi:hypothetical protein
MRPLIALSLLLIVDASVLAADADAPKYAPTIVGRLTSEGRPMALANLCLRTDGTEIRQCAYADFDGRFYLPTLGATHMKYTGDDEERVGAYPQQWLELGTRGEAVTKLYPIELVDGKKSVLRLDCDLAKHDDHVADGAARYCQVAPEQPAAHAQARR